MIRLLADAEPSVWARYRRSTGNSGKGPAARTPLAAHTAAGVDAAGKHRQNAAT